MMAKVEMAKYIHLQMSKLFAISHWLNPKMNATTQSVTIPLLSGPRRFFDAKKNEKTNFINFYLFFSFLKCDLAGKLLSFG